MNKYQLSIAMCTYNGENYLQEQLESIAGQTRLPDELVVCDDCSRDNTVKIIKKFANTVPFPVHIFVNDINLGSTKNFEKAISLCKGDIIALSDQDDVWHADKLMCIERVFLNSTEVGVVFTDAEVVDEQLNAIGYTLWQAINFNKKKQKKVLNGKALELLLKGNFVTGATMAFQSKYKDIILPIPDDLLLRIWVHDGWISLLIAAVGSVTFLPIPLIKYRQHSNNQAGLKGAIGKTKILNKFINRLLIKSGLSKEHRYQYRKVYARLLEKNSISAEITRCFRKKRFI